MNLEEVKARMVRITRAMIYEEFDLLLGCLMLAPLCVNFDTNKNQELITFIVVAEDLVRLRPNTEGVVEWKNLLQRPPADLLEPLRAILELYRPHILEACRIVYDRLVPYRQRRRYDLVQYAKRLLDGDMEFWTGCWAIAGVRTDLEESEWFNPLLTSFLCIVDDLENYPAGDRSRCDPVYLARTDKELAEYRQRIEQGVYEDCRKIIQRYSDPELQV
jgi:hypothetical protein